MWWYYKNIAGQIIAAILLLTIASASQEGESCLNNGVKGKCVLLRNCPAAIIEIRQRKQPQICQFSPSEPVVCCRVETEVETTTKVVQRTTLPVTNIQVSNKCEPLAPSVTAQPTGRKAWDKCIEYQNKYVYPCQDSIIGLGMERVDNCNRKPDGLILGGEDAYIGEFPHMALLGYSNPIYWLCGGILISEKYILTAGHCTYSKDRGRVLHVKIGILTRSERADEQKIYNVLNIIKYPTYDPPIVYNDIALLETDRPMYLNRYAVPACLHDGHPVNDTVGIVTGWGTTLFKVQADADILQKVSLTKFSEDECEMKFRKYQSKRYLPSGFHRDTQICYGDRNVSKDSCQGDSGGPLQTKHPQLQCMYSVLGVTSWGRWCGRPGEPGVYTRVSHFLPWIESIVWPD